MNQPISDATVKILRNDDLLEAQQSLHEIRPPRTRGTLSKGWLGPSVCWALYKQFGVVRQLLNKIANQTIAKGYTWKGADIQYDWTGVASELETKGLATAIKKGVKWTHVEGGSLVVFRLDEVQRPDKNPDSVPYVKEHVRGIKRIEVYSASQARPVGKESGAAYWDTCEWYEVKHRNGTLERVHASRCVPMVVDDVPMGAGMSTLYSSTTGWPPSWLDGILDSLQSWRDAESTTDQLLHTVSLLVLQLHGAREAMTSPDAAERAAFAELVQAIVDNLSSTGALALPEGDVLGQVSRNTGGVEKLLDGKKETFVSDTGYSAERVLMKTTTGLGDTTSGARLNDHETIEGLQEGMCTPTINKATEFVLMGLAHYEVEVPTQWVVDYNSLATQSEGEKAKTRKAGADSRVADTKAGVPADAILSDPELAETYPALAGILEMKRLAEEAAQAAAKAAGEDPTKPKATEELVSASVVGARLGVSAATVLALRARGSIRGWKVGGRWRFSWQQVQAALGAELGALQEAQGQVGDAARRALGQLRSGGRIDSAAWDSLAPALLGCRMDALPPGLELSTATQFGPMWGASEAMREVFSVLERVAPTDLPVLILGETGTGKDGCARGLHEVPKRKGPFIPINCATLGDDADDVAEVLLGDGQRPGLFEQANGGTLFLDEVGELSEEAQAVLLRALSGDVRRAGGQAAVDLVVRVVSATWKEIGHHHHFRRDLYERLAGVVVELPPLRERGEDVLELAARFLAAASGRQGIAAPTLSADARAVLLHHPWPGNIRELLNAINRGVVFAGAGGVIEPEHLQLHVGRVP